MVEPNWLQDMTKLDDLYEPMLVSGGENGKSQGVHDPAKYVAGQDLGPHKSHDLNNMHAHMHRGG